jgi:mannosylglycerate hydrolase
MKLSSAEKSVEDSGMGSVVRLHAHYIPNSHLDREWTMDFQHTRCLTVAFIDHLLAILDEIPEYEFLMDSQTVPLEDYLQVRPEERGRIERHVASGRLHIGPWYSAPDMNMILGESIVRNLLIGHREAQGFGKVMKTGYTPFGFVHISQLPQIYRGFGIGTCFFYRGISKELVPKAEFFWEAPDGSRVLASRMSDMPRYNYYMNVWRKGLYADQPERLGRVCKWSDGQQPFKICDEATRYDQGTILKRRFRVDREEIKRQLDALIERERKTFRTPELALMHGFDTSAPDRLEDEVLRLCQEMTGEGVGLFYSSLPAYAAAVEAAVDADSLPVLRGEMKNPEIKPDGFQQTFINVISTRPRQKQLATRTELRLVRQAEPFAAIACALGVEWPAPFFGQAWRHLLKCHAHDTIAGCAIDRVEEDATYHLRQADSLANCLLKDSLGGIQVRINTGKAGADEVLITIFNPSPFARTETVACFIDLPSELDGRPLRLEATDGTPVPTQSTKTGNHGKIYRDPQDLALYMDADEVELLFEAVDVPGLGYAVYRLRAGDPVAAKPGLTASSGHLENDFLRVAIAENGSLRLTDKTSGRVFDGLHVFEDVGEAGHPWMHRRVKRDVRVTSENAKADLRLVEDSALRAAVEVRMTLEVPATSHYDEVARPAKLGDEDSWRDPSEMVPLEIVSTLTLTPSARVLDIRTRVENRARNHRLRVLFPTGLKTDVMVADNPFDVIERPIPRDANHPLAGIEQIDYTFLSMIGLGDGQAGFGFLGRGLKEYEVLDDEARTLCVTLFRSCETWLCTTACWDRLPDEGLQSLGRLDFHYQLAPHAGTWNEAGLLRRAEALNLPLIPCQSGADPGGAGKNPLALRQEFLSIDNPAVVLSGLKKAEESARLVLRVYNPSEVAASARLTFGFPVEEVLETDLNEEPTGAAIQLSDRALLLEFAPKQVRTLALILKPSTSESTHAH